MKKWAKKSRKAIRKTGRRSARRRPFKSGKMKKKLFMKSYRVKGTKRKVSKKTEVKRCYYQYSSGGVGDTFAVGHFGAGVLTYVWSNNGVDGNTIDYFPGLTQGTGGDQLIGDSYVMKYADVRFTIFPSAAHTPALLFSAYRLSVFKSRQPGVQDPPTNASALLEQNEFFAPIATRKWDVMFDKVYMRTTGKSVGTTLNTLCTGPKTFRFKIPLRQMMKVNPSAVDFTERIFITVTCLSSNTELLVYDPIATYYYIDP